ncbi:putative salivary secreted peptide [Podospora appendiculata]|uniref:Salivary secreted peptide n=1 Tax=Podospora appendiculata TaxID=314037 RepID=A0AAE0XDF5_9PEZI|nr:putative salivary secreted peptide [Podospora appendiculata]
MKSFTSRILVSLSLLGASAVQATTTPGKCNANDCARAVTGTRQGPAFTAKAKEDCSSFVVSTAYGATVTVTAATTPTAVNKVIPPYATACDGASAYASACSCYGIPSGTVTRHDLTTSVTVIAVSVSVPASTTSTVSPPPAGPTYEPSIPTGGYASCDFDPASGGGFELLSPNALAIVNQGPPGSKAVESTDPEAAIPQYTFVHPSGAPANVFDVVIPANGGVPAQILAIYKSGEVSFVSASSNGQAYVPSPSGGEYVTTVWSVQCNGLATAGIIGGARFYFTVQSSGVIVASTTPPLRRKRDIPVPEGFYVMPAVVPTPAGSKCPSPVQHATTKNPPVPVTSNGCGPADWRQYFIPNLEFVDACNYHDVCWSTCSETMASCNAGFLSRMLAICAAKHTNGVALAACNNLAHFYHGKVSGPSGAAVYTAAIQTFCDCACDDPALTACQDQCVDTKTSPDNCGKCNIKCPTGLCTNGACSFKDCGGKTCQTFGPCGPGGSCVCASTSGGTGFCVDGNTPCSGLADCGTSADCPLGSVCALQTCCERNVCITTDSCGGYNSPARMFMMARDWNNATVGHLALV